MSVLDPHGEPCESCGIYLVAPERRGGGRILLELPFPDGRTQRMPEHTPERCREARAS